MSFIPSYDCTHLLVVTDTDKSYIIIYLYIQYHTTQHNTHQITQDQIVEDFDYLILVQNLEYYHR